MRAVVVLVLAFATFFADEGDAQRVKKKAKKVTTRIAVRKPGRMTVEMDLPVMRSEAISLNGMISHQDVAIVQTPEPLIGVHYLLEYPKAAQERHLEATLRFFATVKLGMVTGVVIQGDADPVLMDAVRAAVSKLKFDASWHTPDKQEFVYTKEVSFRLPDNITARP